MGNSDSRADDDTISDVLTSDSTFSDRSIAGSTTTHMESDFDIPVRTFRRAKPVDYRSVKERCLKRGSFFEDFEFPADISRTYVPGVSTRNFQVGKTITRQGEIVWRRPRELERGPQFLVDDVPFDVVPGGLNDSWLLSSFACLTNRPGLLRRVVPSGQGFSRNYAGVFHFHLWRYGSWMDVVIDDCLPVYECAGRHVFLFMHSKSGSEFWSALLEKAFAKFYGLYNKLDGGDMGEALVDLTGGIALCCNLLEQSDEEIVALIEHGLNSDTILGCYLESKNEQQRSHITRMGLIEKRGYTLFGLHKVKTTDGDVVLLRVYNLSDVPRHSDDDDDDDDDESEAKQWIGSWSAGTDEWETLSNEEKARARSAPCSESPGFWMSLEDFKKEFEMLYLCFLEADETVNKLKVKFPVSTRTGPQKSWKLASLTGCWTASTYNAESLAVTMKRSFEFNPQFVISVKFDSSLVESDGKCTLVIALMRKPSYITRSPEAPPITQWLFKSRIGFAVFPCKDPPTQKKDLFFFRRQPSSVNCMMENRREVTRHLRVVPGDYVIVPTSTEEQGDFLLRVLSHVPVEMTELKQLVFVADNPPS